MLKGRSIQDLAAEVLRQKAVSRDFLAVPEAVSVVTIEGPSQSDRGIGLALDGLSAGPFGLNAVAHEQIAEFAGIPMKYWRRMVESAPELAARNANEWIHRRPEKRMVRTLDSRARAFLSDGYRPDFSNVALLEAALPAIEASGAEVVSSEITERRLYVQVASPKIEGEVKVGDVVRAGLVLSNSEVGEGGWNIDFMLFRLACMNGAVLSRIIRRAHVGARLARYLESGSRELVTQGTRALETAALFSRVRDEVSGVMSDERFAAALRDARRAVGIEVADPIKACERVAELVDLSEGESGVLLEGLVDGGSMTAWGMVNAVTSLAHEARSYDRSVELERAGGRLLALTEPDWARLVATGGQAQRPKGVGRAIARPPDADENLPMMLRTITPRTPAESRFHDAVARVARIGVLRAPSPGRLVLGRPAVVEVAGPLVAVLNHAPDEALGIPGRTVTLALGEAPLVTFDAERYALHPGLSEAEVERRIASAFSSALARGR